MQNHVRPNRPAATLKDLRRVGSQYILGLQSRYPRLFDKTVSHPIDPMADSHEQVGRSHQINSALNISGRHFSTDLCRKLPQCRRRKTAFDISSDSANARKDGLSKRA